MSTKLKGQLWSFEEVDEKDDDDHDDQEDDEADDDDDDNGEGVRQKTSDRAWVERLALADLSLTFMMVMMMMMMVMMIMMVNEQSDTNKE